jgi:7,8-dihydropterin-6-yl-methyl-4-(beta-D-ribofuranosyl)aminobenzene 5'-phosphate synthase
MFTITEIYNNIPCQEGLTPDWGFSCLINETGLLFDTGAKGEVLLANMQALRLDPAGIRYLVLSHDHWDHTGGLRAILAANPSVEVFVHNSFSTQTLGLIREYTTPLTVDGWTEITRDIAVTGPLGTGIREQSLVVSVPDGSLVITGCAHPHISQIIRQVARVRPVWGVIGGLHTVTDDDSDALARVAYLSPSHCTDRLNELQERYQGTFRPGGVGRRHQV